MLNMMLMFISSIILSLILLTLTSTFSKKSMNWREKWSPFECGFNFFNSARIPFSIQFFLIAIIFIIFDVEIALLIPLIPTVKKSNILKWFVTSMTFMIIIICGTILEWKENSFEWKK